MTVSTTTPFASVFGDDVLTSHDFGFDYDLKSDVTVEKNNVVSGETTVLKLGEDYTITDSVASFKVPLETDNNYAFIRDTGHIGRVKFPAVWKMRPSAFGNSQDVQVLVNQEVYLYSKVTLSTPDFNQTFTTTEKIIMPSFTGVQIDRSGFYDIEIGIRHRPINASTRSDTDIKIRLRIGKDGDLTSDIKRTKAFVMYGETNNTDVFYRIVPFECVYIAAGQKFTMTAEASETPDGDFAVFNLETGIWVTQ